MSKPQKIKNRDGSISWRIRFINVDGKRESRTVRKKSGAVAILRRLDAEKRTRRDVAAIAASSQMPAKLMTFEEVAARLAVPVAAVQLMVKRRLIPHIRLSSRTIRFKQNAISAWLDSKRVKAEAA